MSKRTEKEFLGDIEEAVRRIKEYIKEMSYEEFLADLKTQDAVVRNLEVIGEAVKNIPDEVKEKHSQIPWKKITGARDRLIHHYFGVNYDIVWTIITEELTEVLEPIAEILWKLGQEEDK